MKIGYIFADWKGTVLQSAGGSVHIQEIVCSLRDLGHDVFVLAANRGQEAESRAFPAVYEIKPQLPLPFGAGGERVLARLRGRNAGFPSQQPGEPVATSWAPRAVWGDLARDAWARLWDRHFYRQARRLIERERPDALYERYVPSSSAGARLAQTFGLPLILEMNTSLTFPNEWWHRHSPLYPFWIRRAERKLCARAHRIVVVSSQLERYLLGLGIPRDKIVIMPNGADPQRFRPDPAAAASVRQRHGLGRQLVVGFIGSLRPWHDVDLILDSAKLVVDRCPSARFLVVGDGPLRSHLEQRARGEGLAAHVIFTGPVSRQDAPAYINAMDIALAPAPRLPDFHFSPLKLFEYMAAAKPVIASRYPDTEAVIADGDSGLLVEPGDRAMLSEAIVRLAQSEELRQRLGRQARLALCEKFTWQGNARRIVELYFDTAYAVAQRGAA